MKHTSIGRGFVRRRQHGNSRWRSTICPTNTNKAKKHATGSATRPRTRGWPALGLAVIGGGSGGRPMPAAARRIVRTYPPAADSLEAGDLDKAQAQYRAAGWRVCRSRAGLAKAQLDAGNRDGAIETLRRQPSKTATPGSRRSSTAAGPLLIDGQGGRGAGAAMMHADAAALEARRRPPRSASPNRRGGTQPPSPAGRGGAGAACSNSSWPKSVVNRRTHRRRNRDGFELGSARPGWPFPAHRARRFLLHRACRLRHGARLVRRQRQGRQEEAQRAGRTGRLHADGQRFAPLVRQRRQGRGSPRHRQTPAIADGRVFASAVDGGVHAFDLQGGARLWSWKTDLRISGGPGAGDGLVVVGSLKGDVVALDAETGANAGRRRSSAKSSPPAIGQGMVLVRSNDGP